jgi:hypothetical protein
MELKKIIIDLERSAQCAKSSYKFSMTDNQRKIVKKVNQNLMKFSNLKEHR